MCRSGLRPTFDAPRQVFGIHDPTINERRETFLGCVCSFALGMALAISIWGLVLWGEG